MDDAQLVCVGDRLATLQHVVDHVFDRERSPLLEECTEVAPFEVFHHDVGRARVELPDVVHPGHVLALDAYGRTRLLEEPGDRFGLGESLREQEFQRDELVELHVTRRDDDAHPALAQHALDPVLSGGGFPLPGPARPSSLIVILLHAL